MNKSRSALDIRTKKSVEDDLKAEPIETILVRNLAPAASRELWVLRGLTASRRSAVAVPTVEYGDVGNRKCSGLRGMLQLEETKNGSRREIPMKLKGLDGGHASFRA
jgi:hypothetical protein